MLTSDVNNVKKVIIPGLIEDDNDRYQIINVYGRCSLWVQVSFHIFYSNFYSESFVWMFLEIYAFEFSRSTQSSTTTP